MIVIVKCIFSNSKWFCQGDIAAWYRRCNILQNVRKERRIFWRRSVYLVIHPIGILYITNTRHIVGLISNCQGTQVQCLRLI